MKQHWIAVASADHVAIGLAGGFMQVCHGKAAPLARLRAGDAVVYYSPTFSLAQRATCQCFTALGQVASGAAYQVDMGGGFQPYRKNVHWLTATHAPIRPLLPLLGFTAGKRHWAYPLRYGLLAISAADFAVIAAAMGVTTPL